MDALRGRTEGLLPVDYLPGVRSLARGSLILAVVLLATLADGCQRGAGQSAAVDGHKDRKAAPHFVMTADTPYVTIFVTTLGNIEVNGKPADLQVVAGAFTDLAKQGGVVLYSRESPDKEPPESGMKVIELAVQNRLPIRLCKNRDFSDAVSADGKLKTGE